MSFHSAQDARIYVATLASAAYARTVSMTSASDMLDVTTLADRTKQFIPGADTSSFSIAGPLDVSGTGQYAAITALKGSTTNTPISYLPVGADGAVWLIEGIETSFDTMTGFSTTADWAMTAQTSGITDFNGVVLENNTTVTVDTNGTAVDNGAGTSNGAVLHLHVTAFSGFTSDAIRVEHSTNNSVWATLDTFTTATTTTSERRVVAGTVNRYLRVVDDVTGTGSVTRFVAVSRR